MRKVWLTVVTVTVLTLALALPALAAVSDGNASKSVWNCAQGTVIQAKVPSFSGSCPTSLPCKTNPRAGQCPRLDLSKILPMAQIDLTDCLKGFFGGFKCQSQNNCN